MKKKVKKSPVADLVDRIEKTEKTRKFVVGSSKIKPVLPSIGKSDFSIVEVHLSTWGKGKRNNGGFEVSWQTKSAGFGSTTVYITKDGKIRCDNEAMGRGFLKSVFEKLVDGMELDS